MSYKPTTYTNATFGVLKTLSLDEQVYVTRLMHSINSQLTKTDWLAQGTSRVGRIDATITLQSGYVAELAYHGGSVFLKSLEKPEGKVN